MIVAQYVGVFDPLPADLPLHLATRIYIAFALIAYNNGHWDLAWQNDTVVSQVKTLLSRLHPSQEVFVSVIGDWGENNHYLEASRDAWFPRNVLKFLQNWNLSGLDVDWEVNLEERALSRLVQNLSSALHPAGLKLTLATFPTPMPDYNFSQIGKHLDQINVMSYGGWHDLAEVVQSYLEAGFPPHKIVAGISTEWPSGEADTLGPNGTIVSKVKYAREHGLAGVMEWRLDNDYGRSYKGAHEICNEINPVH